MTSNISAGLSGPPQRSMSGAILQRPAVQRSLSSQQYAAIPRRADSNAVDFNYEYGDTTSYGRQNIASRAGGSKLRNERTGDMDSPTVILASPSAYSEMQEPEPEPSARGKPALNALFGIHDVLWDGSNQAQSLMGTPGIEKPAGSMPMPRRPGQDVKPPTKLQKATPPPALRRDTRPKPWNMEVPLAAPHYPPDGMVTTNRTLCITNTLIGHVDFFPWTRNHPEDQFTDSIIRIGYFDKAPPTLDKEKESAKQVILPGMKHKSGLQSLSNLLTNILAQRRSHGQVTAPPTFKPPPRVTLTDTKRELWLKELANPATSKRKLSRTIPHGIRGKQLLDQCWNKKIPTERAVWLTKCIGANELRANKRKGISGSLAMGGEAKWLRDWTANIEQWVDAAVAACGDDDWKDRISYAIRLSAHLYSEHLVDRDHYLDWLSSSLETSTLAKLPAWILVTQVYWTDLLGVRKHGRHIVEALSAHLDSTQKSPDHEILAPLRIRIADLLRQLLITDIDSFIMPKTWGRYRESMRACLASEDEAITELLDVIDVRNRQVLSMSHSNTESPRQALICLLDKSIVRPFSANLPKDAWQLPVERSIRASTILEWATSLYRPGLTRIYAGARILRSWSRAGIDVSDVVLAFLGSDISASRCSSKAIYHLVSELARSGHFSMSRYLQWLIARGGIRGPADLAEDGPCPGRLLAELPTNDLPENIVRLRNTMLGRADFSAEDEEMALEKELTILGAMLPNLPDSNDPMEMSSETKHQRKHRRLKLSRAIKSEMALWLRGSIRDYVYEIGTDVASEPWTGQSRQIRCAITQNEFNSVREVLEDIEDISILADVLKIVSNSDSIQILGSIADTVNYHLETFAAIGALEDLFKILISRFSEISNSQHKDVIGLLVPITDLAARIPSAESTAADLSKELARRSTKNAAEACSPVSDEMAEALQTEAKFSDEVEKVLTSGNTMDPSTMTRLFSTIILRLETSWVKHPAQQQECGSLLTRLRNFDKKHFDGLLTHWLAEFMGRQTRPTFTQVLSSLIGQGCLEMATVVDQCLILLEGESNHAPIAIESIELLFGTEPGTEGAMSVEDFYRLSIKRVRLHREQPEKSLSILRKALLQCEDAPTILTRCLSSTALKSQLVSFLQVLVLNDLVLVNKSFITPLSTSREAHTKLGVAKVVDILLHPRDQTPETLAISTMSRITQTMYLAGDMTFPFCQLQLQMIFASDSSEALETEHLASSSEAFESAINAAVDENNTTWIGLVKILDINIARQLCERAEALFLQIFSPHTLAAARLTSETDVLLNARRALFICEATSYSLHASRAIQTMGQVIDRFAEYWNVLSSGDQALKRNALQQWLPIFMDFVKIQSAVLDKSKLSDETRARLCLALSSLLLTVQQSPGYTSLETSIYDILLLMTDELSEESRQQCIRTLKDKVIDVRICYAFGYGKSSLDWLQLSQKGKLLPYSLRRWETMSEPTPNMGENDASLSLTLFQARRV